MPMSPTAPREGSGRSDLPRVGELADPQSLCPKVSAPQSQSQGSHPQAGQKSEVEMAAQAGIEPATHGLTVRCSTTELLGIRGTTDLRAREGGSGIGLPRAQGQATG